MTRLGDEIIALCNRWEQGNGPMPRISVIQELREVVRLFDDYWLHPGDEGYPYEEVADQSWQGAALADEPIGWRDI